MPISLISLAAMGTIQKNISTKVRPVGLHKYKGVRICAAIYEKGITFTKAYRKHKETATDTTFVPSIFIAMVHPPFPHPKSPMWQKTGIFSEPNDSS